ncbi:MAG: alternative ribosome rescue aminoacyl-tRNA hydrolase ArfB [Actinomycetota bacterium]|nr:alternative ribosome rescue aminoacyl-tRNA hydrolase ArfB [Actinomycetota bacterium]
MATEPAIAIGRLFTIPAAELVWRFDPSGGPGGQHANKASTRAELSWDLAASPSVPDELRDRIIERLGGRAPGGILTVSVDETRSQWRNRAIARRRLAEILVDAARRPKRRIGTRPNRAAKRRRLEKKRKRAELKRLRQPPEAE